MCPLSRVPFWVLFLTHSLPKVTIWMEPTHQILQSLLGKSSDPWQREQRNAYGSPVGNVGRHLQSKSVRRAHGQCNSAAVSRDTFCNHAVVFWDLFALDRAHPLEGLCEDWVQAELCFFSEVFYLSPATRKCIRTTANTATYTALAKT